jgi:hypothetical protein
MYASLTLVAGLLAAEAPTEVPKETLRVRLEAAEQAYKGMQDRRKVDPSAGISMEDLALWSRRIMEAKRALSKNKEEEIAAVQEHLARMTEQEATVEKMVRNGAAARYEVAMARYHRAEAEALLAQLKGK